LINNVLYVSVVAIRFALVGWGQVRFALVDIAHTVFACWWAAVWLLTDYVCKVTKSRCPCQAM